MTKQKLTTEEMLWELVDREISVNGAKKFIETLLKTQREKIISEIEGMLKKYSSEELRDGIYIFNNIINNIKE